MPLREYRRKRRFGRTPEPRGGRPRRRARGALGFTVQKHAARSLHYDFRLEHGGVLWSWAVPKGPSLDPRVKRLALQVEDHPLEYASFEGVIPEGEYGAGSVLVWDRGTWQPEGDPEAARAGGRLDFTLEGEKLRGRWHLVRTRARRGDGEGRTWLLIKGRDDQARSGARGIVERAPESVLSSRRIDQIGRGAASPRSSRSAALPRFVEPELATLVDAPPEGEGWLHELKLDGYRIQARVERGAVRLLSRRGIDWARRFPTLVRALRGLADTALFDGEVVVLREGVSDFQALQAALSAGDDAACVYYAFDLLHLDGRDLRELPLLERKTLLRDALRGADSRIRFSDHASANGAAFFRAVCEKGAEGAVCKRADAPYRSGRGRSWLKVKCTARQEFVVGGYTAPAGARKHLGALLIGVHDREGELRYAGKVGTGFDARALAELSRRLAPLARERSPFADPPRGAEARGVRWVRPQLVVEVELVERTRAGRVRHASFRGLREDKPAAQVVLEEPAGAEQTAVQSALTHPDRALFDDPVLTKRDLADYYAAVAEWMLPHVAGRPLTLLRCPEGAGRPCFFQRHPARGQPDAIHGVDLRERGGVRSYMTVVDAAGLAALVQLGALEIHTWGARAPDLVHPDLLTFDLDPDPSVPWEGTVRAARELRELLGGLGLESFAKTTGGKGLHLVVPIEPRASWKEARAFARAAAEAMVARAPDRYLAKAAKAARRGKIFLDYLRNAQGASAISPYSTRARPGAPVATPVAWSELGPRLDPRELDPARVLRRLARLRHDPWEGYTKLRQALPR